MVAQRSQLNILFVCSLFFNVSIHAMDYDTGDIVSTMGNLSLVQAREYVGSLGQTYSDRAYLINTAKQKTIPQVLKKRNAILLKTAQLQEKVCSEIPSMKPYILLFRLPGEMFEHVIDHLVPITHKYLKDELRYTMPLYKLSDYVACIESLGIHADRLPTLPNHLLALSPKKTQTVCAYSKYSRF